MMEKSIQNIADLINEIKEQKQEFVYQTQRTNKINRESDSKKIVNKISTDAENGFKQESNKVVDCKIEIRIKLIHDMLDSVKDIIGEDDIEKIVDKIVLDITNSILNHENKDNTEKMFTPDSTKDIYVNPLIGKKYTNANKSIVYTIKDVKNGHAIMDNDAKIDLITLADTKYFTQVHEIETDKTSKTEEIFYNENYPIYVYYFKADGMAQHKVEQKTKELEIKYKYIPNMLVVPTEGQTRIEQI